VLLFSAAVQRAFWALVLTAAVTIYFVVTVLLDKQNNLIGKSYLGDQYSITV